MLRWTVSDNIHCLLLFGLGGRQSTTSTLQSPAGQLGQLEWRTYFARSWAFSLAFARLELRVRSMNLLCRCSWNQSFVTEGSVCSRQWPCWIQNPAMWTLWTRCPRWAHSWVGSFLRLPLLRRFWGLFAARCFGQTYQKMLWVRNRHWTLEQLAVKNGACFKSFFNE